MQRTGLTQDKDLDWFNDNALAKPNLDSEALKIWTQILQLGPTTFIQTTFHAFFIN